MTENKIEPLAAELRCAIVELREVERERNACLGRWAELRGQLEKDKAQVGLTHSFERETSTLHLLDARLEASKRRVLEADGRLGGEVQRWALLERMSMCRTRAA
jgi:hypothetical protein